MTLMDDRTQLEEWWEEPSVEPAERLPARVVVPDPVVGSTIEDIMAMMTAARREAKVMAENRERAERVMAEIAAMSLPSLPSLPFDDTYTDSRGRSYCYCSPSRSAMFQELTAGENLSMTYQRYVPPVASRLRISGALLLALFSFAFSLTVLLVM